MPLLTPALRHLSPFFAMPLPRRRAAMLFDVDYASRYPPPRPSTIDAAYVVIRV